ncbi:MAG: hypothetical protein GY861_28695, partial [bacterium]|nr:hypothetical protein [bacterium]
IRIECGGNDAKETGTYRTANGTYTEILKAVSGQTVFIEADIIAFTGDIDNVSVTLISADNIETDLETNRAGASDHIVMTELEGQIITATVQES